MNEKQKDKLASHEEWLEQISENEFEFLAESVFAGIKQFKLVEIAFVLMMIINALLMDELGMWGVANIALLTTGLIGGANYLRDQQLKQMDEFSALTYRRESHYKMQAVTAAAFLQAVLLLAGIDAGLELMALLVLITSYSAYKLVHYNHQDHRLLINLRDEFRAAAAQENLEDRIATNIYGTSDEQADADATFNSEG